MLELIPGGLDLGNGWPKLVIKIGEDEEGNALTRASKIPNWSTENQPKGRLNEKKMLAARPIAFPLKIKDDIRWFGQDTLSLSGSYEMDQDKLKPDYIRMMFKAVLFRWLSQHRIEPKWLSDKRLNIVCGMPPELYQDRQARNKAEDAYRFVFDQNKPDYIKQPDKPGIPFFTAFGGLKPETLAWRAANKMRPGYTLLVDLGYGTSDLCLLHSDYAVPISTITLNNGLLHSHHENNPIRPWEAELATMRGVLPANYANIAKAKIRQVARQINLAQLVVFGGGARLLDAETIKDLRGYAPNVSLGKGYDEFSNARWFERISRNGIKVKKNAS
jgi:hypothetical protein